ncbi:MAG: hypothetical protein AAGC92_09540 [Pseudomonadota bacterium]
MFDLMPQTAADPIARDASPARAIGRWTVMDHIDIADRCSSARTAIAAARCDAEKALEAQGAAAAGFRTLGLYWERKGAFVHCRAEVEAWATATHSR